MSMLDKTEIIEKACPVCGGDVEHWYFDGDCGGSPSCAGFDCKGTCNREWSPNEWRNALVKAFERGDR